MATPFRKFGFYILSVAAFGAAMVLLKYISFLFGSETRARILRLRTSIMFQTVLLLMSVYVWTRMSPLFDRDLTSKTWPWDIHGIIKKWESLKITEKSWRIVLLGVLLLCNCSYSTYLLFLSSDPYKIAIAFFLCFALTVQLFTGLVLTKLLTLLATVLGCTHRFFQKYSRMKLVIVLIYAVLLTSFGYYNTQSLPDIKEITIPVKDLPTKLNGLTITFIPDIHIGPTVGKTRLEKLVNMVNYLQSDLVVIGGDLVDGPVKQLEGAVEPLDWIKSKYGTYFVTGNHEYYTADVHNWMKKLASFGIRILHNENVLLPTKEEQSICLAGVNDPMADEYLYGGHTMNLYKALESCDASKPVILIAHRPQVAKQALESKHRVDLVLSGHTHGGQFFPIIIGAYLFNPYYAGLYRHGENSHVYVSMGTFFWGFPVRFGTRSEISVITLRPLEH